MSHFTVLVIGDNAEEQLAPFQENNMDDCPKELLTFHDTEDEYLKQYNEESVKQIQLVDGSLHFQFDNRFQRPGYSFFDKPESRYIYPDGSKEVTIPFKELYSTFEIFMKEYAGSKKRDPKTGRYGYWENPNAKWDWYSLGGRWTGYFKLKPEVLPVLGRPGVFENKADPGWGDSARIKDIDFDGMRDDAGEKAAWRYDTLAHAFGGAIPNVHTWKEILDGDKTKDLDIDAKRKLYHGQEALVAVRSFAAAPGRPEKEQEFFRHLDFDGLDDFACSRAEYIQRARDTAISSFAVLKDGKWYERGEMGWFGCVADEKGRGAWEAEFTKLIDGLPPETLLSVYDCHI